MELTDINLRSTANIIEYNLNKWINFEAKHFESILIFLNRSTVKIRKFVVHSISTWAYLCVRRYETVIHELVERKRKRGGRERRPCERESCAIRKVEGCGVFWEGSHRITTRSDLVRSPVSHCSRAISRLVLRFAQRALLGTIYSTTNFRVLFTRKSKITRVISISRSITFFYFAL